MRVSARGRCGNAPAQRSAAVAQLAALSRAEVRRDGPDGVVMTTTGANALSSGTESVGFVLSTGGLRPHLHVPRTGSAVHRLRGHGLDQDTPASAAAVASR
eukprot:ctg_4072.g584